MWPMSRMSALAENVQGHLGKYMALLALLNNYIYYFVSAPI